VHFLKFGAGIPFFAASLLLAIVLWGFFQETTSQGMTAIVGRGDILRKINIPKYIVVVSASVSALINLGINLVIVLIFALISGVELHWSMLVLVPVIIELYIFALSVAMILAALYVKFRDLSHIWEVIMQAAYFATPIIYPISMIMSINATAAKILMLSPMTQIIQDARHFVVYSGTETVWNTIANPLLMIVPLILVAVVAVIAALYFRKASKRFTELV
jgi:ABC-2 type transport system permease protein